MLDGVESLVFPAGVGTDEEDCANMESLKKVTYLGDNLSVGGFMDCTKLEKVAKKFKKELKQSGLKSPKVSYIKYIAV